MDEFDDLGERLANHQVVAKNFCNCGELQRAGITSGFA
jgi:hypothetical protein